MNDTHPNWFIVGTSVHPCQVDFLKHLMNEMCKCIETWQWTDWWNVNVMQTILFNYLCCQNCILNFLDHLHIWLNFVDIWLSFQLKSVETKIAKLGRILAKTSQHPPTVTGILGTICAALLKLKTQAQPNLTRQLSHKRSSYLKQTWTNLNCLLN